jgi:hypothetical protein
MRNAVGAFGLICGAIVVWTVANYGYGSSDDHAVKWNMAFLFGAVACGGLFGHAVAARLWRTSKTISAIVGLICAVALIVNLSNSLAALAGRADRSTVERVALNKRIRADEAELARLQRLRDGMPPFMSIDADTVTAAKRVADTAADNRRAECGNGDPKQRGPNCRQREIDEKEAADKLAVTTSAKSATERAAQYEASMAALRKRLAASGPVVTVNVQGSALARLFRLPDTEATFAETLQQFGMAAVVELLIAFALIAWELLKPVHAPPTPARAAAPTDEPRDHRPAVTSPPLRALPKPRLVSSKPITGSVNDFVVARLEPSSDSELGFGATYDDYTDWCHRGSRAPVSSEQFAIGMRRICERSRIRIEPRGGTAVFVGLRIAGTPMFASAAQP